MCQADETALRGYARQFGQFLIDGDLQNLSL